jgi:hypothetical protein
VDFPAGIACVANGGFLRQRQKHGARQSPAMYCCHALSGVAAAPPPRQAVTLIFWVPLFLGGAGDPAEAIRGVPERDAVQRRAVAGTGT